MITTLALILLVDCGGDAGSDTLAAPTPATTTASTGSTVTTGSPAPTSTTSSAVVPASESEIVARYKQFWEVRFEANRHPVNPADPRLAQLATGLQLENVRTETRERLDQGLAFRRPEPSVSAHRVKTVEIVGDTASLQDCSTNDGIVYRVADGQVVDDSVVTRNVMATMLRVDGVWRLAEARVIQKWEGVAGCAQSPDFS